MFSQNKNDKNHLLFIKFFLLYLHKTNKMKQKKLKLKNMEFELSLINSRMGLCGGLVEFDRTKKWRCYNNENVVVAFNKGDGV